MYKFFIFRISAPLPLTPSSKGDFSYLGMGLVCYDLAETALTSIGNY